MIAFPNCKINLGLHILRKRADGFHDLDTVFYPVLWQDVLEIVQAPLSDGDVQFSRSGLDIDAPVEQNICVRAYRLLKEDFPHLPAIKMHLHKLIPSGAGLGGGSSDGAFTLGLLNKIFNLDLNEEQLIRYALHLGSDCPFFVKNKPCHATGRGEKLESIDLDLSNYRIILVNPGIHIATAQAFSKIIPNNQRTGIKELVKNPVDHWKNVLHNDFEESIFAFNPEIKKIKEKLYQVGAVYASMSGSGSTVFGFFEKGLDLSLDFPSHYLIKRV